MFDAPGWDLIHILQFPDAEAVGVCHFQEAAGGRVEFTVDALDGWKAYFLVVCYLEVQPGERRDYLEMR